MRTLLNTLFVLSEDSYLALQGENAVVERKGEVMGRFPLHTLENILCFSYAGASPALMGECAGRNIQLSFYSPQGKFYCQAVGGTQGNVLLRREQYRRADDAGQATEIARAFLTGKLYNAKWVLERTARDYPLRVDAEKLKRVSALLTQSLASLSEQLNPDTLRGVEGAAAQQYFGVFDEMILQNKNDFCFRTRSRRPPLDRMNALLSFTYTLLSGDCAAALRGVGLDPYVGYLHTDRPGRISLALDLMEELRPAVADRFALTMVNNRKIRKEHFEAFESGAVLLNESGRRIVLSEWQNRKKEIMTHPFLKEKLPWGLVPYVQALLLARCLRQDLDGYPPLLWK